MKYNKTLINICSCIASFFMVANVSANKIDEVNKKDEQYYAVGMATNSSKMKYYAVRMATSSNKMQSAGKGQKETSEKQKLHSFVLAEEIDKRNRNKN